MIHDFYAFLAYWMAGWAVHRRREPFALLHMERTQMRLFGGILPFIGWRVVNLDNDGEPCEERSHWFADAIEVEWFGVGAIVYVGKVYPSDPS